MIGFNFSRQKRFGSRRAAAVTRVALGVAAMLVALGNPAMGDTPMPPRPEVMTTTSPNGAFTAVTKKTGRTRILDSKTKKEIWSMPGWRGTLYLSNDGRYAVTSAYVNLLPKDYPKDMVLFTFWKQGKKLRDVRLDEVVPDLTILRQTASHWHWGDLNGMNTRKEFAVTRVDGQSFVFDLETGKQK